MWKELSFNASLAVIRETPESLDAVSARISSFRRFCRALSRSERISFKTTFGRFFDCCTPFTDTTQQSGLAAMAVKGSGAPQMGKKFSEQNKSPILRVAIVSWLSGSSLLTKGSRMILADIGRVTEPVARSRDSQGLSRSLQVSWPTYSGLPGLAACSLWTCSKSSLIFSICSGLRVSTSSACRGFHSAASSSLCWSLSRFRSRVVSRRDFSSTLWWRTLASSSDKPLKCGMKFFGSFRYSASIFWRMLPFSAGGRPMHGRPCSSTSGSKDLPYSGSTDGTSLVVIFVGLPAKGRVAKT
mmetsp:Transcript_36406/g.87086  ORF Transcript_36406/g.87086 Transcript_36406/m.87086 type:complete len:299 (-) Transcript_36406:173-1069(-)